MAARVVDGLSNALQSSMAVTIPFRKISGRGIVAAGNRGLVVAHYGRLDIKCQNVERLRKAQRVTWKQELSGRACLWQVESDTAGIGAVAERKSAFPPCGSNRSRFFGYFSLTWVQIFGDFERLGCLRNDLSGI
jgi:hypothetical protein